jgi:4-hydroxybenzoate polyprenyltransferase
VESDSTIAEIFRGTIHSSIYLAIGGIGLGIFSSCALPLPFQSGAYAITFSMIFGMYNMNRYSDINEDILSHPKRHSFVIKYRNYIQILSIFAVFFAIILGFTKNLETFVLILIPLSLGFVYSFKLFPKKLKFRRLKDIPLVKNLVIAFCWAIVTTGIVTAYAGLSFTFPVFCVATIVFTRLFINTIIFDVRDREVDEKNGTYTLPVFLGVNKTKIVLYIILTILVIFSFIAIEYEILPPLVHLVNLTSIQAYYYIYLSGKEVPIHTVCDVVADGEFIIMGIAALIGTMIFPYPFSIHNSIAFN